MTTTNSILAPRVLHIAQFCQIYGISRSTFYQLVQDGAIEPRKILGSTVVPVEEAERWLASLPSSKLAPLTNGEKRRGRPKKTDYLPRSAA